MNAWLAYLTYCLEVPIAGNAVCRPFWLAVGTTSGCLGLFLLGYLAGNFIIYQMKLIAALRAEAQRNAVNTEAIEELKWRGE